MGSSARFVRGRLRGLWGPGQQRVGRALLREAKTDSGRVLTEVSSTCLSCFLCLYSPNAYWIFRAEELWSARGIVCGGCLQSLFVRGLLSSVDGRRGSCSGWWLGRLSVVLDGKLEVSIRFILVNQLSSGHTSCCAIIDIKLRTALPSS